MARTEHGTRTATGANPTEGGLMARKPDLTYRAPVLSVDLAADGYQIWPCDECLPWHAEVIEDDDGTFVREWHAAECPVLADVMEAARGEVG